MMVIASAACTTRYTNIAIQSRLTDIDWQVGTAESNIRLPSIASPR